MKFKAFSLLELMAVVAILAILVGVAAPMYKFYIIKSRVASVLPIMDGYKNSAISYYEQNGIFPTASQLNIPTTGNNYTISNPTSISPYTTVQIINSYSSCNYLLGEISVNFNAAAIGANTDFYLTMMLRVNNGEVVTTCGLNANSSLSPPSTISYFPDVCQNTNTTAC